jgi:Glycosyl hydrolase family 26
MNGNWFPWGRGRITPRVYKAAWRHLVRIFRAEGADNVKWVWTPNVSITAAVSRLSSSIRAIDGSTGSVSTATGVSEEAAPERPA